MEVPSACPQQQIRQLLVCKLCYLKAQAPLLCPDCASFYCEICVKNYLRDKESKCPHCLKSLQTSQLVNGEKFSQGLGQAFHRLQNNISSTSDHNQNCQKHNLVKMYYCKSCKTALCSDCSILQSEHRNHDLVRLTQIKFSYLKTNNELLQFIAQRRKVVQEQRQILLEAQNNNIHGKEGKIMLLDHRIRGLSERISLKLNGFIDDCQNAKDSQQHLLEKYKEVGQQLTLKLEKCPQSKLVGKTGQVIKNELQTLLQQNKKLEIDKTWKRSQDQMKSQLVPKPSRRKFILDNYSFLRQTKGYIYSDVLFGEGLEWRLKIYPSGIQLQNQGGDIQQPNLPNLQKRYSSNSTRSNEEYLSIYVELKTGLQCKGEYVHQVEITNHKDEKKRLSRKFVSKFDIGQCWGYDCFAKVNKLYNEGFVHPTQDYLEITLEVGAPTYFHAVLDQQKMIDIKNKKYGQISQKFIDVHGKISKGKLLRTNSIKSSMSHSDLSLSLENSSKEILRVHTERSKQSKKDQRYSETCVQSFQIARSYKSYSIQKYNCKGLPNQETSIEISPKKILIKPQQLCQSKSK